MDTGYPESPDHGTAGDEKLVSIVNRVAFTVALIVMIFLPIAYWGVAYSDIGERLSFKARVKAK